MGRFGRWRALQGEAARTDRQLFDQLARSLCRRHWASKVTARGPPPLLAARRQLCAEGLCDSIVQFGSRGHSAERAATALPGSAGGLAPIEKLGLASKCFEQPPARAIRATLSRATRRCGAIFPCAGTARDPSRRVCLRVAQRGWFPGARPADYSAPCPALWSLDSDGDCFAPAEYTGPCVSRKRSVCWPESAVGADARPSPPGRWHRAMASFCGSVRARGCAQGFLVSRSLKNLRGVRGATHRCVRGALAAQLSNAARGGPSEIRRRARSATFLRQRFLKSPRCPLRCGQRRRKNASRRARSLSWHRRLPKPHRRYSGRAGGRGGASAR